MVSNMSNVVKSERCDTIFLRALAISLIFNSHLDNYYSIKYFATGGMIGNALFFMLSSYGLWLSWEVRKTTLSEWYMRRISRIYPATWLSIIFILFPYGIWHGYIDRSNMMSNICMFFYPPFWFLQTLMVFYVLLYLIIRYYSKLLILNLAILMSIIYGVIYLTVHNLKIFSIELMPYRLVFYFSVVLWGLYLANIRQRLKYVGVTDIILLFLSVMTIYTHKYMMMRGLYSEFQFVQHLAVFPMLFYCMRVANSPFVMNTIMGRLWSNKILCILAELTLEIYIIDSTFARTLNKTDLGSGMHVILLIALIIISAYLLHTASKYLRKYLISIP